MAKIVKDGLIFGGNIQRYAEITIDINDIDSETLTCTKTLEGITANSYPIINCLTMNSATRGAELEAFGTLLYADTNNGSITFTFFEMPVHSFTVQVVNF